MPTLTGPKGTYTITINDSDGDLTSDRNRPAFHFAGTTFVRHVSAGSDFKFGLICAGG